MSDTINTTNETTVVKKKEVMNDTSTVEKKIESIVFNTLKDRIRGHIYARMEEKTDEKAPNTLFINISNCGVVYTDRVILPDSIFDMANTDPAYIQTLAMMIHDNFKKYIETVFFIQERPKRYNEYKAKKRN